MVGRGLRQALDPGLKDGDRYDDQQTCFGVYFRVHMYIGYLSPWRGRLPHKKVTKSIFGTHTVGSQNGPLKPPSTFVR